jgi:hypothetical protein
MVPMQSVLAFAGVAVILVAIPGPSVLFTISRALTGGRRTALWNVVGNEVGLVVEVVAVAFGAGALIESSAEVFTAVKLAGAVYIVFLGVQAIRHRRSLSEAVAGGAGPVPPGRAIRDGAVVGATNPETVFVLPHRSAPVHQARGRSPHASAARPGVRVPGGRTRDRRRVGTRRGGPQSVALPLPAPAGRDRRRGRPGHDRTRGERRGNRAQGLIAAVDGARSHRG